MTSCCSSAPRRRSTASQRSSSGRWKAVTPSKCRSPCRWGPATPGSMCTELPPPRLARPRRAPRPGPLVVGLVGRAGSGKSTVARALAAAGARVLDADRIGHAITDGDPDVRAALATEYGPEVYRPDGQLDRKRVAAKVFADPAALGRLNLLVHPRILERLRAGI